MEIRRPTDARIRILKRYGKRESTRIGREKGKGKEKPFTTTAPHTSLKEVQCALILESLLCTLRRVQSHSRLLLTRGLIGDKEARKLPHFQTSASFTISHIEPSFFSSSSIIQLAYLNHNEYGYCNGPFTGTSRQIIICWYRSFKTFELSSGAKDALYVSHTERNNGGTAYRERKSKINFSKTFTYCVCILPRINPSPNWINDANVVISTDLAVVHHLR